MMWTPEIAAFIRACIKVNANVDVDSAFRAYKIVQGNLKVKI